MAIQRVNERSIDWIEQRLTERDRAIIASVRRLRIVTGGQLQRLHFTTGSTLRSRQTSRQRALARLADWRVLIAIRLRAGGSVGGSAGLAYALDAAGARIAARLLPDHPTPPASPRLPGDRYLAHAVTVSELAVRLTEHAPAHGWRLDTYQAEPDCWWPAGNRRSWLKPDAYTTLTAPSGARAHWWLEIDRATEATPTIKNKLASYVEFADRHHHTGPGGIVPYVLVTTPDQERAATITHIIHHLPEPADRFITAVPFDDATLHILQPPKETRK